MTKSEIRAQVRSRRRELDTAWIAEHSRPIQRAVIELPEFGDAATVGCYVAMRGEVETGTILQACRERGKRVCVPAMREQTGQYALAVMQADTPVVRRPGGVPEPLGGGWVGLAKVDVIVVPGVAFDGDGGRLGRGGGHYDRILAGRAEAAAPPLLVGLGFEFQIVGCVPTAAHDVRLDLVLTEDRVLRAGRDKSA